MKLIGRQTIKSHQQEPAELLLNRIISRTYRNVGRLENEGLRESQQQALQFVLGIEFRRSGSPVRRR